MGPRLVSRGNPVITAIRQAGISSLQWGRDSLVAEITRDNRYQRSTAGRFNGAATR